VTAEADYVMRVVTARAPEVADAVMPAALFVAVMELLADLDTIDGGR
jgi:hypothetical protein